MAQKTRPELPTGIVSPNDRHDSLDMTKPDALAVHSEGALAKACGTSGMPHRSRSEGGSSVMQQTRSLVDQLYLRQGCMQPYRNKRLAISHNRFRRARRLPRDLEGVPFLGRRHSPIDWSLRIRRPLSPGILPSDLSPTPVRKIIFVRADGCLLQAGLCWKQEPVLFFPSPRQERLSRVPL